MKNNTIISPIFYMGNKKKLINKGLIDLFPKNINRFYELFSGSGIVSMNVKANEYILSDKDVHLAELYNMFKSNSADKIIFEIEKRIKEFNLPKERTKRNIYQDKNKIECYKQGYINLRKRYNETKNVFDFYTLMFFSFSQQFRFNNKNEFNMPFGNDCFSDKNKEYIRNGCNFFKNDFVEINLCSFSEWYNFLKSNIVFKENDFVYLDPPYNICDAVYNERQDKWCDKDELELYKFCEELNKNNIKFALSNVFINKGKENKRLIEWTTNNNLNVFCFDEHTYTACGKGNSKAKEVLITNYKTMSKTT